MVAWVTAGLSAPGVKPGSGSPGSRSDGPAPVVDAGIPVAVATNEAPGLLDVSSSASALDAAGEAETVVGSVVLAMVAEATEGLALAVLAAATGIDGPCRALPFGAVEAETPTATI
jgi:hypothetical protein